LLAVRPIPLVDVKAQYAPLLPRVREAIEGVLASGEFILGPNVGAFEREAADYLGVREAVGVANGTDALVLVMDALEIGPGDEVICPAFTFYATAESIVQRGATPVFADVDAATMNLDPADVAERITPKTKAIMPVHLFGRPAPLGRLERRADVAPHADRGGADVAHALAQYEQPVRKRGGPDHPVVPFDSDARKAGSQKTPVPAARRTRTAPRCSRGTLTENTVAAVGLA